MISNKFLGEADADPNLAEFMKNKSGRAFIENEITSSQRAYEKAGFRKVSPSNDGSGFWWQNF